jgi:hypothetical protein
VVKFSRSDVDANFRIRTPSGAHPGWWPAAYRLVTRLFTYPAVTSLMHYYRRWARLVCQVTVMRFLVEDRPSRYIGLTTD